MVGPIDVLQSNAEQKLKNLKSTTVKDETHLIITLSKPYSGSELELQKAITNGNHTTVSITDTYKEHGDYCYQIYHKPS